MSIGSYLRVLVSRGWAGVRNLGGSEARWLVALLTLIGVLFSGVAGGWLWYTEQQRAETLLERRGQVIVDSTEDALGHVAIRLRAVGGLIEATGEVTQNEFRRFVERVGLEPGLGGLGYMPIVAAADLAGFVAEVRETIPDYTVFELDEAGRRVEAGGRAEYVPVLWFEPFEAFGRPHGFDSISNALRRDALQRARRSGELAITPFLQLVSTQETDGFLMYWPVTAADRVTVRGFAVAPMDLSDLLNGELPEALLGTLEWSIIDHTGQPQPEPSTADGWVGTLEVGGRRWELTVVPTPGSDLTPSPWVAVLVFLGGTAASMVAGGGVLLRWQRSQSRQELHRLQQATRARDQFLASVGHGLRTPLTGVVGFAQLLQDTGIDLTDRERRDMIATIANDASDLAHVIDDLLVEARSQIDTLAVTQVPVAVPAQIAQVLEATRREISDQVEVITDPQETYRANGDPARVRQILRNLISNAHQYGGGRIQVHLTSTPDTVHVQIRDNGTGIPPIETEGVFQPYQRAHQDLTQPATLGIGLSVARQLARLMGGDITYRREDSWTIFELQLPATTVTPTDRPIPQTAHA